MEKRIERFNLNDYSFSYKGYPVAFFDIYGKNGIQIRTTISEMGPLLLSRILGLNDLQSDILNVVFKIADDNNLLLIDIKDLKSILSFVDNNSKEFESEYGKISSASIGVIVRALVSLEKEGGNTFFGEPALNICDWLNQDNGKGVINILDSSTLINNGKLYSTFLLWMMSELFETLPEVGDLEKPKMIFFFDEAHLLFDGAPKVLVDKIEQMVKLIRSKGVGIYFCTQNPKDIPNGVLSQLGNKIEHGLRAYTPADQKSVKAVAESFRINPSFNTYETILNLGTGEAVVSFLGEDGIPSIAQKAYILPPQCSFGTITDLQRDMKIKESLLYSKYYKSVDNESAYEFLQRKGIKDAELREEELKKQQEEKENAKIAQLKAKEDAKKAKEAGKTKNRVVKSIGNSITGTLGRQVGKSVGKSFGSFGKTLGGNVGASLGRGLFSTLFKK